jgi:hypothetical protein
MPAARVAVSSMSDAAAAAGSIAVAARGNQSIENAVQFAGDVSPYTKESIA